MRKTIIIFFIICECFLSCSKQADIQKIYNSGSYISIVSYDITQFPTSTNNHNISKSNIGFAMVYSKAEEKITLLNTLRHNVTFDHIRYNKISSDDTQICLQSDQVRFVIMNSGETYIVKIYTWQYRDHDWQQTYSFSACEIMANESFELPSLDYSSALDHLLKKEEVNSIEDKDEAETHTDTYQVVEANSYDGYVSIRKEKSSQSLEVGRLPNGDMASYLCTEGEWIKIDYNGKIGYVYSKYAKINTMIDP